MRRSDYGQAALDLLSRISLFYFCKIPFWCFHHLVVVHVVAAVALLCHQHERGSDVSTDGSVAQLHLFGLQHCEKHVQIISLRSCKSRPGLRVKRRMRENQLHHQEMKARDTLSCCSLILLYVECVTVR